MFICLKRENLLCLFLLLHYRIHRTFLGCAPALNSDGKADDGSHQQEGYAKEPPMHRGTVGKGLNPPFIQGIGHRGGNDKADHKDAEVFPIEHHKDSLGGGTEHLADADFFPSGLCLEKDEAEDSDKGDKEGNDGTNQY